MLPKQQLPHSPLLPAHQLCCLFRTFVFLFITLRFSFVYNAFLFLFHAQMVPDLAMERPVAWVLRFLYFVVLILTHGYFSSDL